MNRTAFTLVELAIVLVIIGLLVGGILVGSEMISQAAVRSQITQIEKYNQAVNTFKGKYGGLPGDILQSRAATFGLAARGNQPAEGDGNGVIEGNDCNGAVVCTSGFIEGAGETCMFWVDLAASGLINNIFNTCNATTLAASDVPSTQIGNYLPEAKLGQGQFVYVYSRYATNYYAIAQINGILSSSGYGVVNAAATMPVLTAYNIDNKIDDGLPITGTVTAQFTTGGYVYALSAGSDTIATCFHNSGTAAYSTSSAADGGTHNNCALSIRFQ